ncbi:NADH dehydrogenase [ubiquinone] 1 beta subcomplex subunit 5, mitochondrial [Danaus plexippus]|uniref:NADH dehydrogenase [ubiquinone] 1 beta subcomplex subunit 5, mitochondrial n=1 Tax=Danaus plexippus plexippus TaxID=278856 RepID=A0A212EP40_DANPL|nr:NADH dehydrogenase [ubiquinone] 1 beta subcomplex subunit 5, mitochondrial [Danaus plexippus]OWR43262.1 lethal [Danaus plexippus plexippus]
MVSWSALGRSFGTNLFKNNLKSTNLIQNVNFSLAKTLNGDHGHKSMVLQPSRWQWHKFKDMFHYYLMVGLIPVGAIVFYTNVFIGPAELTPIPEDYVPKHWEYHRHPITRFIARYIHNNPQQDYEKFMHYIDEEAQKVKLRALEKMVTQKMAERNDYQAYYYRPMVNKYLRVNKQVGDEIYDRIGDNHDE